MALCLAHSEPFKGVKVCVVEADAQGSLRAWLGEREDNGRPLSVPVFHMPEADDLVAGGAMAPAIRKVLDAHDLTILDCPGESAAMTKTRFALAYSDVVLLPLRASEFDMSSVTGHVLPLIESAGKAGNPDTTYHLLPTMVHVRAGLARTVGLFEGTAAGVLQAQLPYRKVFAEFPEDGRTLKEYSREATTRGNRKQAKKALGDIDAIAREVATALSLR